MNQRVRPIVVVFTAVIAACTHPEASLSVLVPGDPLPIVRLRAEPYSFSYNSGLDQPGRIVVRDHSSWQALWAQIYRGYAPVPPVPAVDFSRDMLVVVALGLRSSGGYSILVDTANEARDSGLVVTVRSISPGPKCGVTAALTQPVDIARVPRRDGEVSFLERSEVHTCE